MRQAFYLSAALLLASSAHAQTNRTNYVRPKILQGALTAPGSPAFHLKASITREDRPYGTVEIFWFSPRIWRRELSVQNFHQTIITNNGAVSDDHSADYVPTTVNALVEAAINPAAILSATRNGDRANTLANHGASVSGATCYGPGRMNCFQNDGVHEVVAAAGDIFVFAQYKLFHKNRIARQIMDISRLGAQRNGDTRFALNIDKLEDFKHPNDALFHIDRPTPPADQLRTTLLGEDDLRRQHTGNADIIWPQPLDGAITGPAQFVVSVDREGHVREVMTYEMPGNERTMDTALSQLKNWTFRPLIVNGVPTQTQGMLSFTFNTRAYGPRDPLTNEEVRKLATNTVNCLVEPGTYPTGTTYSLWVAVDSEGRVIEVMAGDGPSDLFSPCYDALKQWKFAPIMEDGQPRPYRANIIWRMP